MKSSSLTAQMKSTYLAVLSCGVAYYAVQVVGTFVREDQLYVLLFASQYYDPAELETLKHERCTVLFWSRKISFNS